MNVEQPIMITDTNSDDGVKDDFNSDDLKTLDNNQWLNDKVLHQRSMIVLYNCAMRRASFKFFLCHCLFIYISILAFCSLKNRKGKITKMIDLSFSLYIPSCSVQRGK